MTTYVYVVMLDDGDKEYLGDVFDSFEKAEIYVQETESNTDYTCEIVEKELM